MAGSNMSTAKGIVTGIKAGFNPRLSLDPYESERAKKVGPRSLNRKDTGRLGEGAEQVEEAKDIQEASVTGNPGYGNGYHGNIEARDDKERDKRYSAAHTYLKKFLGERGHLKDAKQPNKMVKHFLDSPHGRHLANSKMSEKDVEHRFTTFKKVYDPSMHEETSLDEAKVDHREFATAGIMHPDMAHAPRMKAGNMTDFYSRKNGDKLHGKILSNDNKTVRIEHEGKVHKFDVDRSLPTSMYKEDKDDREYGYEGDMAMSQLKSIIANAQRLHDMLEPETDLPEWVQSKITLAEDYVVTATNYCAGELDEEVVVEGSKGKTPETKTEVNLAKKHGDPNKITYGDVIQARIQSGIQLAKNKALKKGD